MLRDDKPIFDQRRADISERTGLQVACPVCGGESRPG